MLSDSSWLPRTGSPVDIGRRPRPSRFAARERERERDSRQTGGSTRGFARGVVALEL